MGWILGFGIPLAYVMLGLFISRATYRSRIKRDLNGYIDSDDTFFLCVLMFVSWPLLAPFYFPIVWWGASGKNLVESFYKHNLPESNRNKRLRLEREASEAKRESTKKQNRIDELEKELGIGPYSKDLI